MFEVVILNKKDYPIRFGMNALRIYCKQTNRSLNDLQKLGQDMSLDDAVQLMFAGLRDWSRVAGKEFTLKLEKPIKVLIEGANLDVYKPLKKSSEFDNRDLYNDIKEIKEDFAYLFVGHWMQGELGEDRKNVGLLIKAFYEVFKNRNKVPALILKTSQSGASYMDRREIQKRIDVLRKTVPARKLPNIYLLHGEFTDKEMSELYNNPKVKAMVS